MHDAIRIALGQGQYTLKRSLPISALRRAGAPVLSDFLAFWKNLGTAGLPSADQFLVEHLFTFPELVGRIHVVDVKSDKPLNASFQTYAAQTVVVGGLDYSGAALGDTPATPFRDLAAAEYRDIKRLGKPDFSVISTVQDNRHIRYRRLVLPLSGDGRNVTQLMVCFLSEISKIGAELANDSLAIDMEEMQKRLAFGQRVQTFIEQPSFRITVDFGPKPRLLQMLKNEAGVSVYGPIEDRQRPANPGHKPR